MAYLQETLTALAQASPEGGKQKGDRFEHLIRAVFSEHPGQWGKERFRRVWTWAEWPGKEENGYDGQDIGIDLVAEQTAGYGGGLCAVQCKFHRKQIPASGVDSFLAAAPAGIFASRLLVATAGLSRASQKKMDLNGAVCLYTSEMDSWVDDWRTFLTGSGMLDFVPPKKHESLWEHQTEAAAAAAEGFLSSDRGKLVLPCGAGKSLTALRIAEEIVGSGGAVLYLVPSLALVSQTMNEWSVQKNVPLEYLAVCSDPGVGRTPTGTRISELACPVTTDPDLLAERLDRPVPAGHMRAVFATYQSAGVVAESGAGFDLAVCDEAHRTTGIDEKPSGGESPFKLIHDDSSIYARKRLYMTATPRVFTAAQKRRVSDPFFDGQAYSMEDPDVFGPLFHQMSFAEAVDKGVLADYRIVILAIDEDYAWQAQSEKLFYKWADDYRPSGTKGAPALTLDDAVRLTGVWDALATPESAWPPPADHRAGLVKTSGGKWARSALLFAGKVSRSKEIAMIWKGLAEDKSGGEDGFLGLEVNHIDGKTPAAERIGLLNRLREADGADNDGRPVCEVLTNVKVLTEGVDVPGLDAVVFLDPKTSAVDITQAVGRAMRRGDDRKTMGTVVIPVVINLAEDLTSDMTRTRFEAVGRVVRGLRSHDERVDYWLADPNVWSENPNVDVRVISENRELSRRAGEYVQTQLRLTDRIASVVVDMAGDRRMWPSWGARAAEVCGKVLRRMKHAVRSSPEAAAAADEFAGEMAATLAGGGVLSGGRGSALEMAAQHVVTMPVFDQLFEGRFSRRNPVSVSIERLLAGFDSLGVDFTGELRPMRRAYQRLKETLAAASMSPQKRLDIIRQIYDKFFEKAMPGAVKRLGIVYTPIEIVEFMCRSADAVCRQVFGREDGLASDGVQFLDPFSGTGTFTAQLLEGVNSDGGRLIPDGLLRDVWGRLHSSELTLLSYYVGAVNVEGAYHRRLDEAGLLGGGEYQPWVTTVLRDTFLETDDRKLFNADSNEMRAGTQQRQPIDVILANPPWSSGQDSAGDDNPNLRYDDLSGRVRDSYSRRHREVTGRAPGGNSMGNLYVKALRWCSDRVLDPARGGRPAVIGFVHPNSLTDATSMAGVRACLRDEFTNIYVVNLLGDANKQGEEWKAEGDKVFGSGSRNGTQITFLVYNPQTSETRDSGSGGVLRYAEVPRYSRLEEKWKWLNEVGDVMSPLLEEVPVNEAHHWKNLTDSTFVELMPVCSVKRPGGKQGIEPSATRDSVLGVATACDTYVYSFSRQVLEARMKKLIEAYEDVRWEMGGDVSLLNELTVNDNLGAVKWTSALKTTLRRNILLEYDPSRIREVLYRPFVKLWLYEDDRILSSVRAAAKMFPRGEAVEGQAVTGGSNNGSPDSLAASDALPDLNSVGPGRGGGRWLARRRF